MKVFALLVAAASFASAWAGLWLGLRTLHFALGPDYRLFHGMGQNGDGNGLGIFFPALLLLGLAWYLAKFARNLWRA